MKRQKLSGYLLSALTLFLAFLMFFPILWMVLTSFKPEQLALAMPPRFLFAPTLENYNVALFESPYLEFLWNTLLITGLSTLAALLIGVPIAYAMAFYPTKRSESSMLWMMSTRMLPPAGVIVPLYIIFQRLSLLDTHLGMIIVYTGMNLPLVVWMLRSFMARTALCHPRGGAVGRRQPLAGVDQRHVAAADSRPCCHRVALCDLHLERILPGGQFDDAQCIAALGLYFELQSRAGRPLCRQDVGCGHGDCATGAGSGLGRPAPACYRIDNGRGEVEEKPSASRHFPKSRKPLRAAGARPDLWSRRGDSQGRHGRHLWHRSAHLQGGVHGRLSPDSRPRVQRYGGRGGPEC